MSSYYSNLITDIYIPTAGTIQTRGDARMEQEIQEIREKIEALAMTTRLGLAVALYWNKLPKDFLASFTFDELHEMCREKNVPAWLLGKIVIEMEKKAQDFWQWNTVFYLTPSDTGPFSSNRERGKKAISKMETLTGDNFDMLHTLARTAIESAWCSAGSPFRDAYERVVKKMDGMKMTFNAWHSVYNSSVPGTELHERAFMHMLNFINEGDDLF